MMYLVLVMATLIVLWVRENGRRKTHPVPEGHQPDIDIPHSSEFELYHNALSLCSMKTRLCMAELGIPYVSHHIDLIETGAYENIRPKLLSVNPGGTVPVLVHEGHPIYESHAQIRYAAGHAPDESPSLTPDGTAQREEMEEWIDRSSLAGDPMKGMSRSAGNCIPALTLPLFASMIVDIPFWKIFEGLFFHFDKRRPLAFTVLKVSGLRRITNIKPMMTILAQGRTQMAKHLDLLEEKLEKSGGPWILGDHFSLADVSWLVIFERLAQTDFEETFMGETAGPDRSASRPNCAAYWERSKAREGYAEAIQGHLHPTVVKGTARLKELKGRDAAFRIALEGS